MPIIKRETDYALRALARLAGTEDFIPVSALAEGEDIPEDFLRKIMQTLHHAGIVESRQGPFGGYRIVKAPAEVTLLDVLRAVQGPPHINECFQAPEACARARSCPVRRQLAKLQAAFNREMELISLDDMLRQIPSGEGSMP